MASVARRNRLRKDGVVRLPLGRSSAGVPQVRCQYHFDDCKNLREMGYTNIESMDDGWKGWLYAGLPAAKD